MIHLLLYLFVASAFLSLNVIYADKSVVTSLNTKWAHTSFLAETSEFFAAENNEVFWGFVENSIQNVGASNWSLRSYEQEYDTSLKIASSFLTKARFSLLKFVLSLRLFSPRIQVFQQIAYEYPAGSNCVAFVDVNGAVTCNFNDIKSHLSDAASRTQPALYNIDHIYAVGKSKKDLPIVILYADIDSPDFGVFHAKLKKLAELEAIQYIFRHFKRDLKDEVSVGLTGYGVELAIKNTEYKAIDDSHVDNTEVDEQNIFGFDFNVLRKQNEDLKESLNQFKLYLLDTEELAPLKQWEVADLSFQAAQLIMEVDPEEALPLLTDIAQNFPIRSRTMVQKKVNKALRDEITQNQEVFNRDYDISEGDNAFFFNGINIDVESLDIFQLYNTISKEESLASAFYGIGFRREYLSVLYKMDLTDEKISYSIDFRNAFPEYINDLDKDKSYREWGNSVKLLLQPFFPGMIRPIARNLFTLICVIELTTTEGHSLIKIAHSLFVHQVPLRIGFVFVVSEDKTKNGENDVGIALLNFYNFAKSDENPAKAINLLIKLLNTFPGDKLTVDNVHTFFKKSFRDQEISDVFSVDSDYSTGKAAGSTFLRESGLQTAPKLLLNGVLLDDSSLQSDKIEELILAQIMRQTVPLQKAVLSGRLTDRDNVQNWILSQPEILPRVNNRLLHEPSSFLALYNVEPCTSKNIEMFLKLELSARTQCILEGQKYLTKTDSEETKWLNVWLVSDFNTVKGRNLLRNGLKALKKSSKLRLSILHNGMFSDKGLTDAQLIHSIIFLYPSNVAKQMLNKLVGSTIESEENADDLPRDLYVKRLLKEEFKTIAVHGANLDVLQKTLTTSQFKEFKIQKSFIQKDLKLDDFDSAIIVNGLVYGPFNSTESFEVEDFLLLEKIFERKGAKELAAQIDEWKISKEGGKSSDVVMRSIAIIGKYASKKSRQNIKFSSDTESVVNIVSQDTSRPVVEITAIVNPLSRNAQKLAPILQVLLNVVNCDLRLAMNSKSRLSELPLKNFYRYVLNDQPQFNSQGKILTPSTSFLNLPSKQLFTLNLIAPDSWMVQPIDAKYDLDNIKMKTTKKDVVAKFELVNILLEGHCFDEMTGNPPRGLQYILGTNNQPSSYDTIVMANLGYFQLKASPGAWILKLREGKSRNLYEIKNVVDGESQSNEHVSVLIDSFLGKTIRIRVAKRAGMEMHNLLSDSTDGNQDIPSSIYSDDEESNPIWSAITNTLVGGETHEKINIFSLASGHLYERFLRIMMLSVMKNTKHPVKFWLLNNYLSPHFRKSIPKMAEKYRFEYELIEYKWPRWLHQQREKNRIMWGYKILFLDVLFPLDVKKIIFVDADQVVRADMMELMNLDLGGAPYGYTPFCESRTSMDGFRFWKQGYWANHLAGRKYHISALYVVDLVKFRQIAAGDRLRGQYQGLSSDPNSLSNLDQDLPNNMIHQVRIKSLPQEWLWCETWCNEESKKTAKTIDLCNNPQTKEPKLDSAMRIIPEWNSYDLEIKEVLEEGGSAPPLLSDDVNKKEETIEHGDEL